MRRPTTGPKKTVFVCMHVSPVLENAWTCRMARKVGKQERRCSSTWQASSCSNHCVGLHVMSLSGCMLGQTRLSKCVLTWNEMRTSRNDPIRYATLPLSVTTTLPEAVRRRQLDLTVRRGPHPFLLASSASPASAKDGGGGATKMARERLPCYACHRRTGQPHQ